MTTMMRAALIEAHDGPFLVRDIPRPEPGPGEVLVRIAASGVNPLDTKIRAGAALHARHPVPAVLGLDMAGVVAGVGAGVTRFAIGDEVYGMVGGVGGVQGTLADYAAVDADLLARKPANLSMREAAVLPLITITAWEGLVDRMNLAAGETLLVQGGAGGVGHVVVQIGRALGARVLATASAGDRAVVEGFGATFIDRTEPVTDQIARCTAGRGFDKVYDTVGGKALDASFEAVRRFGHVVSSLGWGTHALAPLSFKAASYSGVFTLMPLLSGEGRDRHGIILEEARALVERGQIAPRMNPGRYGLDTIDKAYDAVVSGTSGGKTVIDLQPDA